MATLESRPGLSGRISDALDALAGLRGGPTRRLNGLLSKLRQGPPGELSQEELKAANAEYQDIMSEALD